MQRQIGFETISRVLVWVVAATGILLPRQLDADEPSPEQQLSSVVADELRADAHAELKIRKVLLETTQLEFIETPLIDVVNYLEDLHGIQIELARRELDQVGLSSDAPVTRELKGITLRAALELILADMELTYVIHNEVLQITTRVAADDMEVARVYQVADLLDEKRTAKELAEAVTLATALHANEPGSAVAFGDSLIVRASHARQHRIARLLALLRATDRVAEAGDAPNQLGLFPMSREHLEVHKISKPTQAKSVDKPVKIADPFGEGVAGPGKPKPPTRPVRDPFGGGVADPFGGGADPFGGGADPFGGAGTDPFGGAADPFAKPVGGARPE